MPFKACDLRTCAAFAAISTFLGGKWIRISNFCPTCYCLRSIIWADKKAMGANSDSLTFDDCNCAAGVKIDYLAWLKTCPQHPQLRFQSGQQLLFHFESYHPVTIGADKKPMVATVLYGVWLRSGGK